MCIFHLCITIYVYNNLSFNPSFKPGSTTLEFQSVITVFKERRRSIVVVTVLDFRTVLFCCFLSGSLFLQPCVSFSYTRSLQDLSSGCNLRMGILNYKMNWVYSLKKNCSCLFSIPSHEQLSMTTQCFVVGILTAFSFMFL